MLVRCPCGGKFYTSTADFHFIGELLYICPKCKGFISKDTAKKLEVVF